MAFMYSLSKIRRACGTLIFRSHQALSLDDREKVGFVESDETYSIKEKRFYDLFEARA